MKFTNWYFSVYISYLKTTDAIVRLNTKMGFIAFDIEDDKYKLKYTATAYSI